ncbi:hypothetical protein ACJX0J_017380, partial [Zea mays]
YAWERPTRLKVILMHTLCFKHIDTSFYKLKKLYVFSHLYISPVYYRDPFIATLAIETAIVVGTGQTQGMTISILCENFSYLTQPFHYFTILNLDHDWSFGMIVTCIHTIPGVIAHMLISAGLNSYMYMHAQIHHQKAEEKEVVYVPLNHTTTFFYYTLHFFHYIYVCMHK